MMKLTLCAGLLCLSFPSFANWHAVAIANNIPGYTSQGHGFATSHQVAINISLQQCAVNIHAPGMHCHVASVSCSPNNGPCMVP